MSDRVFQNETGTWLATWLSIENTPPMEDRIWVCAPCRADQHEFFSKIPPISMIDWHRVSQEIGPEQAERFHDFLKSHRVLVWEKIAEVGELSLKKDVTCQVCGASLNHAISAFVEVF